MSPIMERFTLTEMEPDCDCIRRANFDTTRDGLREFLSDVEEDSRLVVIDGRVRIGRSSHCSEHGAQPSGLAISLSGGGA